jgi:hypothetical protein
MIEGAELTIYSVGGENFGVSLSDVQLYAVCKVLGLKFYGNGEISHFSDDGLKSLIDDKVNIWNLELKKHE